MLLIDNEVVKRVLNMRDCIDVQERAFAALAVGEAISRPRIDMFAPCDLDDGYYRWGSVEGANDGIMAIRMKSDVMSWPKFADGSRSEMKYCMQPGTYCGLVMLFSTGNGEPLAMMNDGHLQHMRVGGAAGLGTKLLSRADSHIVGMIGSGGMSRTLLEALVLVRDIKEVKVYSRSAANREKFAEEMSGQLNVSVIPIDSARDAVRGVDILATCTDSMNPIVEESWLEPGMHIVNIGPFDISREAAKRIDLIVHQGIEGWDIPESRSFMKGIGHSRGAYVAGTDEERKRLPVSSGKHASPSVYPIYADVITGKAAGRTGAQQITQYRPAGNWGVQFSSVGGLVYRKAKELGLGRSLPTEWFLQDIKN